MNSSASRLVAVDLGAESGRVILGTLADGRLTLEELHRFPTPSLTSAASLRWDVPAIQAGIATGVAKAAAGGAVASIAVDTWGVDYGLIDAQGGLVELPYCYRDTRSDGVSAALHQRYGEAAFFARSGVRPLGFNTVFQLAAQVRDQRATLQSAAACIPISDVFHHWLSGRLAWERTQVGTWGLATPGVAGWDEGLLADLDIPRHLFGPITPTGTVLGPLREELARAWGLSAGTQVILPGGHDTASAVAGMGADPDNAAYLSSGTWSLIGCVAATPVLSEAFRVAGYSNEASVDGRVRLNKNIMGLWVVQECRRAFVAAGRNASYAELAEQAARLPPSPVPLEVDDQRFFAPASVAGPMPKRIAEWCRERAVPVPGDDAALVRLVCDGLAAAYRTAVRDLEGVAGRRFARLNIVGGGANNRLLNQLTADAIGREVVAGPGEATALGNLLVQARALGLISGASEARAVLSRSVELTTFHPTTYASAALV